MCVINDKTCYNLETVRIVPNYEEYMRELNLNMTLRDKFELSLIIEFRLPPTQTIENILTRIYKGLHHRILTPRALRGSQVNQFSLKQKLKEGNWFYKRHEDLKEPLIDLLSTLKVYPSEVYEVYKF